MAQAIKSLSDDTKHGEIVLNPDGSNIASTLPTGAATSAKQLPDNHQVTVSNQQTGLAQDDTVILLRRLVKLLESNAVVDSSNRQKIALETVLANAFTTAGFNTALVGNTVVTTAPVLGTIAPLPVWEGPVEQRWRVMEAAHEAYQIGIRNHLSFT